MVLADNPDLDKATEVVRFSARIETHLGEPLAELQHQTFRRLREVVSEHLQQLNVLRGNRAD